MKGLFAPPTRLLATLLLIGYTTLTHAEFYALNPTATLPPATTPFQEYITQQTAFMDDLRTCSAHQMQVRIPSQPSLVLNKEIFGMQNGLCQVALLTYPANTAKTSAKPVLARCQFTPDNLIDLTTITQYDYVQLLAFNNAKTFSYLPDTPAMAALFKHACHLS